MPEPGYQRTLTLHMEVAFSTYVASREAYSARCETEAEAAFSSTSHTTRHDQSGEVHLHDVRLAGGPPVLTRGTEVHQALHGVPSPPTKQARISEVGDGETKAYIRGG